MSEERREPSIDAGQGSNGPHLHGDSQAQSAGSIPVARSTQRPRSQTWALLFTRTTHRASPPVRHTRRAVTTTELPTTSRAFPAPPHPRTEQKPSLRVKTARSGWPPGRRSCLGPTLDPGPPGARMSEHTNPRPPTAGTWAGSVGSAPVDVASDQGVMFQDEVRHVPEFGQPRMSQRGVTVQLLAEQGPVWIRQASGHKR